MIEWLNGNEGFVMSVLTFVYVLATIIIVIINRISIKEMRKSRQEDNRPYIIANLVKDPRDKVFYLRIKNYGKMAAVIESFDIEPELKLVKENNKSVDIKGCLFPPECVIQFIVLEGWEETCKIDYTAKVSYNSLEKKPRSFSDEYKIVTQYAHLQGFTNYKKTGASDSENALISISNSIDAIRNKM